MLSIFKTPSKSTFLNELLLMLLFGSLSLGLALLHNVDQGIADFRESPLLIHVFYLKNPLYLIGSSLITSIATSYGSPVVTFSIHLVGLLAAWVFMSWLKKQTITRLRRGLYWMGFVIAYYGVFVLPTWILVNNLMGLPMLPDVHLAAMGLTNDSSFMELHMAFFDSAKYEVITTMTVTVLYLMEMEARKILMMNNQSLENLVTQRTEELAMANNNLKGLNKKLIEKNNEIKTINTNLDELARIRFEKIQNQMKALSDYAQVNSHEVRAPLARILTIAEQLEDVSDMKQKEELVNNIYDSAVELDLVIRKINKILTT